MVPYRKIDLIVEAFSKINKKLIVIGDGPDFKKIKKLVSPNVELKGYVEKDEMLHMIKRAKAFIFAAEEDFGIAPIEAQACGVPVIAYGKGGALETIIGVSSDENFDDKSVTGIFFKEQTSSSLLEAVNYFEKNEASFDRKIIRKNAERFSKDRFEKEFKRTIERLYINWKENS